MVFSSALTLSENRELEDDIKLLTPNILYIQEQTIVQRGKTMNIALFTFTSIQLVQMVVAGFCGYETFCWMIHPGQGIYRGGGWRGTISGLLKGALPPSDRSLKTVIMKLSVLSLKEKSIAKEEICIVTFLCTGPIIW